MILIKEVKAGMTLVVDAGFACIKAGTKVRILRGNNSDEFYFECREGNHYLDGQIEGDYYVGLSRPRSAR
jgi:hypothetical protein